MLEIAENSGDTRGSGVYSVLLGQFVAADQLELTLFFDLNLLIAFFQTECFMRHLSFARICLLSTILIPAVSVSNRIEAQIVWSGFTKAFVKPDGSDGSLPANQDALTPNVIFARGSLQGIYNAATEPNYIGTSPEFTEWATDLVPGNESSVISAVNGTNLQFTDWVDAFSGPGTHGLPATLTSHNAVVHLTLDNIYLDLKFTSWGAAGGGGFSYLRAEPPLPPATGDYNGNHFVDAADYVLWRDTLGQTVAPGTGADGNADGTINAGDYNYWKARFGNPAPGAGSGAGLATAVPEPATTALAILGVSLLLAFGRRHRAI